MDIQTRKIKHIEACLQPEAAYHTQTTGLEHIVWPYQALPECNLADIDLNCTFLGKPLRAPILIGAMTGGAEKAALINKNLATAAQTLGLGMMLGSQRVMLEHPDARASFLVRQYAPDILLVGNIGVAQLLKGYDAHHLNRACSEVSADAIALHINPLQEAFQHSGDTLFAGMQQRLADVIPNVHYPVMLKEVGHGLSAQLATAAQSWGVAAVDVAGAGGTSWAKVEDLVHFGRITRPDLAEVGIPTAQALQDWRYAAPNLALMASGGVYSGLQMAKALAMGAQVVALARPLVAAALDSPEAVIAVLAGCIQDLRIAMFVAGTPTLAHLRALQLRLPYTS